MTKFKRKFQDSPGQALVEFALVITFVLMMIFLIIESARILWAWNSVQHAAREGARYAITGQFDGPDCAVDFGLDKFVQTNGRNVCDDLRVASIINESHTALSGLQLDEVSTAFEDDNYYNIEVWGANEFGVLEYDFAGIPNNPVIVRVTYQVPIITPFFTPIRETIPVFGQEVLNNESFGQLGNSQGQALPPDLPPLPTPGVTPSPTPTPLVTDTPTPTPTPVTPTATVIPVCPTQFEGFVVETQDYVFITGELDTDVVILNLTTGGNQIGTGPLPGPFNDHACEGFNSITVNPNDLNLNDVIAVVNQDDGTTDTTIVLGAPPTDTPVPTDTPAPTFTPTPTFTPPPTNTPNFPYIDLSPSCGTPNNDPADVQFNVTFTNWPTNQSLTLFWEGVPELVWQAGQHAGSFVIQITKSVPQEELTYTVLAQSGNGHTDSKFFDVPCVAFPTPTPGGQPTATPKPPDLVILGAPTLISTPPIVAFQPVQFSVPITNAGDVNVDSQFFVDVYIEPDETLVLSHTIPITESDGYSAVSSLAGGEGRVITITAQLGFPNPNPTPSPQPVYGFVDSLEQIAEDIETNNISQPPLPVINVTPAATPTPTATPGGGDDEISGAVYTFEEDDLIPQHRALISLIDDASGNVVATTESDQYGFYAFTGVPMPTTTYSLTACITIDGNEWFGFLNGIVPPNTLAILIMFEGPCS